MKLFLLHPRDDLPGNNTNPWFTEYEKAHGFVIRAADESDARNVADENGSAENQWDHPWLDPTMTTCTELTPDGTPGLILRDYYSA